MKTELLKIDAEIPEAQKVKRAAQFLKDGKIVALPTETVYGLAVNAGDKNAVSRLYEVKKRSENKPFTIQIADFSQFNDYAGDVPTELEIITREFWPGPLTVIINTKEGKTGLRMPDNKAALSIIRESGLAVAVTSANISGEKSVSSAGDVFRIFDGFIEMVVDDGGEAVGIESTVLDCTQKPYRIVRRGYMAEKLERFLRLYCK